jgi:hypothetical protein
MLSLAFSMILFGLLVKTSSLGTRTALVSAFASVAGIRADHWDRYAVFASSVIVAALAAWACNATSARTEADWPAPSATTNCAWNT